MTKEEKDAMTQYQKQKRLSATIAIDYFIKNMMKGAKQNVTTTTKKSTQQTHDGQ